jgi:hypothetical protein
VEEHDEEIEERRIKTMAGLMNPNPSSSNPNLLFSLLSLHNTIPSCCKLLQSSVRNAHSQMALDVSMVAVVVASTRSAEQRANSMLRIHTRNLWAIASCRTMVKRATCNADEVWACWWFFPTS